jgi:hypothetical protein
MRTLSPAFLALLLSLRALSIGSASAETSSIPHLDWCAPAEWEYEFLSKIEKAEQVAVVQPLSAKGLPFNEGDSETFEYSFATIRSLKGKSPARFLQVSAEEVSHSDLGREAFYLSIKLPSEERYEFFNLKSYPHYLKMGVSAFDKLLSEWTQASVKNSCKRFKRVRVRA